MTKTTNKNSASSCRCCAIDLTKVPLDSNDIKKSSISLVDLIVDTKDPIYFTKMGQCQPYPLRNLCDKTTCMVQ